MFQFINLFRKGLVFLFLVGCLFVPVLGIDSAWAEDSAGSVAETTFFGNVQDDGKGCGVYMIVNMVADIMVAGVGILGILGIIIVGVQYLTAGGNEEKTRKAKRRMFEIIIGLVAFVLLYAGVQWLMPGGKLNGNPACSTVTDSQLAAMKEAEKEKNDSYLNSVNNISGTSNTNDTSYVSGMSGGSNDGVLSGETKYDKRIDSKPFKLKVKGASKIKFRSSDPRVAYVTKAGIVYPNDVGNAVITAISGNSRLEIKVKIHRRESEPTMLDVPGGSIRKKKYARGEVGDYNYVFRFKDPVKAEKAADNAMAAYKNGRHVVGHQEESYEYGNNNFTVELSKVGWDPSRINKMTNTACSQFVLAMVESVGIHQKNTGWAHRNAPGTISNLTKEPKHFYTLTESKYTESWRYLRRGDIVVGDGNGHAQHALIIVK